MLSFLYFVVTVLAFIAHFHGLIIRSLLTAHSKLRVAFNNVYCQILKLPPRSSASTVYAVNHIDSFEIFVRKRVVGFIERLIVRKN